MSNREDPSNRYFWASLRPLGRPLFWLPLGVFSLCLLAFWQYQQNPDWLKSLGEQPKISIEDEDRVPASSLDGNPDVVSSPTPSPSPVDQNNAENTEETDDTETSAPISTLNRNNLNNRNKNQKPSLFLPLLPQVTQNANPSTVKPLPPLPNLPPANDTNYPLQGAIDNLSRNNTNPGTDTPNQPPSNQNTRYPSPSTPPTYPVNPGLNSPYQPPVYNSQSANPTVMSNPNPSPVPTEPPRTQGYTIQRPIDARSSGY